MYVRVKHVKVSAVKNKYYIKKNTAAADGKVYYSRCLVRLCIYFLYCTWRSGKVQFHIWQRRVLGCVEQLWKNLAVKR